MLTSVTTTFEKLKQISTWFKILLLRSVKFHRTINKIKHILNFKLEGNDLLVWLTLLLKTFTTNSIVPYLPVMTY